MEFENPIPIKNIGDPYVMFYKGKYYRYATSQFNGYYCWVSDNLKEWGSPQICYQATTKSFADTCFWAPEVYEFEKKFYMYYTGQWKIHKDEELRIGVAVANSPLGPFEDVHDEQPMFDFGYGVLNAHILKDENNNYLYYSRAGEKNIVNGNKESQIYVVELGEDFTSVKGEGILLIRPEQEWECRSRNMKQLWNEGAFVIKYDDEYHMMYSANYYASREYGIGVAVSKHPMGPFTKYSNNPVLHTNNFISGPGHNSVVQDNKGQHYCIYHAHTHYNLPSGDRQVYITPLRSINNRICTSHMKIG